MTRGFYSAMKARSRGDLEDEGGLASVEPGEDGFKLSETKLQHQLLERVLGGDRIDLLSELLQPLATCHALALDERTDSYLPLLGSEIELGQELEAVIEPMLDREL